MTGAVVDGSSVFSNTICPDGVNSDSLFTGYLGHGSSRGGRASTGPRGG